jgi:hypothetical protein
MRATGQGAGPAARGSLHSQGSQGWRLRFARAGEDPREHAASMRACGEGFRARRRAQRGRRAQSVPKVPNTSRRFRSRHTLPCSSPRRSRCVCACRACRFHARARSVANQANTPSAERANKVAAPGFICDRRRPKGRAENGVRFRILRECNRLRDERATRTWNQLGLSQHAQRTIDRRDRRTSVWWTPIAARCGDRPEPTPRA